VLSVEAGAVEVVSRMAVAPRPCARHFMWPSAVLPLFCRAPATSCGPSAVLPLFCVFLFVCVSGVDALSCRLNLCFLSTLHDGHADETFFRTGRDPPSSSDMSLSSSELVSLCEIFLRESPDGNPPRLMPYALRAKSAWRAVNAMPYKAFVCASEYG